MKTLQELHGEDKEAAKTLAETLGNLKLLSHRMKQTRLLMAEEKMLLKATADLFGIKGISDPELGSFVVRKPPASINEQRMKTVMLEDGVPVEKVMEYIKAAKNDPSPTVYYYPPKKAK